MRDGVEPRAETPFDALRDDRRAGLAGEDRPAKDHGRRPGGERHGRGADGVHPRQCHGTSPSSPVPRNYDRTWIRDGSAQALALLWAGLIEEAKAYVVWYAKRIYENGMVPPILNVDGAVNRGYGSDIEFDAQGEFVGIAADVYRIGRDRAFLGAIFEPVVRATRFIEELCARTDARARRPRRASTASLAPSISHEGYSKPSYSYWDDYFALSAWRNCEFLAREIGDERESPRTPTRRAASSPRPDALDPHDRREDEDEPHPGLRRPRRRRSDLDLDRLRALPGRRRASAGTDRGRPTIAPPQRLAAISAPGFTGNYSPYELRNINAFVSLGRSTTPFDCWRKCSQSRRPQGWRLWAEVVWGDMRAPDYIGDMPTPGSRRARANASREFAATSRITIPPK